MAFYKNIIYLFVLQAVSHHILQLKLKITKNTHIYLEIFYIEYLYGNMDIIALKLQCIL